MPRVRTGKRTGSILKDPETHQIIETITAQALGLLLGGKEYVTAIPFGRDDYEKARTLARLIEAVMDQPGVWRTHYQLFKDAFLFGIAILKLGWETRSRRQYVKRGNKLVIEDVIYRDRPLQRIVDHYNFYPDPTGTRINEDMIGVGEKFQITISEAMRLSEPGPNGERPVYDRSDVQKAIAIRQLQIESLKKRGGIVDAGQRFPNLPMSLPQRLDLLDGIEYWGESPIKNPERMSNRVITFLNGVRVRSRGNMFLDGNVPYIEVAVNPIVGRFYGLGVGEVVRFLQDRTDNLLMNFTDAADVAVNSPLLVGNAWGGNDQQLIERRLKSIIHCTDPKLVGTIPVDLGVLDFAAAEMLRGKLTMREASGATNPLQSISGPQEKSATESSLLVKLASQRVEASVNMIERDVYPRFGRMLHSRLKQMLPDGGAIATLGGEPFEAPLEVIDIEADIRFMGSRQAGSKFQRAAVYRTMAEVLGSDAGMNLALMFPEVLVRWFRDGAEIPDAEDIIKKASERALAMKKLEFAAQGGGSGGGGGSAPPPNPNAEESFGTEAGQTERDGEAIE